MKIYLDLFFISDILSIGKKQGNEMLIYRVENEDNEGPYYGTNHHSEWTKRDHNNSPKHPMPTFRARNREFGFDSMKQLRRWFSKTELNNLKKLGFRIVKIKHNGNDVDRSFEQLCFSDKGIIKKEYYKYM